MNLLGLFSRARTWSWYYEQVLGTSMELHVTTTREATAKAAEDSALVVVDQLNGILSGWLPTSELSHWCASFNRDVPVSAPLREVLELAEQWRARTNGAFHPGAQAVIDFLRDDVRELRAVGGVRTSRAPRLSASELRAALSAPLWSVNSTAGTARNLTRLPVSLDAIAKGYIIDAAARAAHGTTDVRDVLLNIGGDVRHIGTRAVMISIADPFAPAENAMPIAQVALRNQTLATSGGYFRQFTSHGRAVSHLVDPRTLRAVDQVVSCSVIANDCATADALSTACSVLTPAESVALVNDTPGAACLLVEANGAQTRSAHWPA